MDELSSTPSSQPFTEAIEENLFEYFRYLGRKTETALTIDPSIAGYVSRIAFSVMNGIFCRRQISDDLIEKTFTLLKSQGTPFTWWVGSDEPSASWRKLCDVHGVTIGITQLTGMAVDLSDGDYGTATPDNFSVSPIRDEEMLARWMKVAMTGFNIPSEYERACFEFFAGTGFGDSLRYYIGMLDGTPVAVSQLFVCSNIAGIYWVATVPEARNRGFGVAITRAPLRDAAAMGCRIGILHSSTSGFGVYRRLGFNDYSKLTLCSG